MTQLTGYIQPIKWSGKFPLFYKCNLTLLLDIFGKGSYYKVIIESIIIKGQITLCVYPIR